MKLIQIKIENQIYEFEKASVSIGKKINLDIFLDNIRVSRQHARFLYEDECWKIEDLNSLNGTWLNGQRIKKTELKENDTIQIADVQLTIHFPPQELTQKEKVAETLKKNLEENNLLFLPENILKERISKKLGNLLDKNSVSFKNSDEKESYISAQLKSILGLGFLEDYLSDPKITEIMINGHKDIYIEKNGLLKKTSESFHDISMLLTIIDRILAPLGRHVDEASPLVDARLPDGSRIHVALSPISLNGPIVTIRKFSTSFEAVIDLVKVGTMTELLAAFLQELVISKKNILISGGTSSGKTTLLNVLANGISRNERLITIEDSAELKIMNPHTIRLEARPENIEGRGEITIRKLVQNALRMRPDRIIIGECRGAEAFDMLQAMNTGHEGCLSTCHANSPRDALKRLENMVMMAGFDFPLAAIREQIASAIHSVIQMKREIDGQRRITHVTQLRGIEHQTILTEDIFNSTKGDEDATPRSLYDTSDWRKNKNTG